MKTLSKSLIKVLILTAVLSSRKVYRDVKNLKPVVAKDLREGEFQSYQIEKLVGGDNLRIKRKDGTSLDMEYQRLQADTLYGISTNNKSEMGELLNVSLPDIKKCM